MPGQLMTEEQKRKKREREQEQQNSIPGSSNLVCYFYGCVISSGCILLKWLN